MGVRPRFDQLTFDRYRLCAKFKVPKEKVVLPGRSARTRTTDVDPEALPFQAPRRLPCRFESSVQALFAQNAIS
jgi:hypothetical protein